MNNQQYVQSLGIDEATQQKCLAVMEKYGNTHWWEPGIDPRAFAYYQLHEAVMLCSSFSIFHEAVELLLGRPVWTHEFGLNALGLQQEAERVWRGEETSDAEKQQQIAASFDQLLSFAEKHDKKVIGVLIEGEEDAR